MAQRRMFSMKIVSSDAFLDMPTSSRELYFQLGMYADDDGFVNPKKIVRMLGASDDDLKVLIGKRFLLPFENGVVVIKHWLINNLVRKDFYQPTLYVNEKSALEVKENKAYTECKQNVNNLLSQDSIGKDRIVYSIPSELLAEASEIPPKKKRIQKPKIQNTDSTPDTPFNSLSWVESLLDSPQPHIKLIGAYFIKYAEVDFPTKAVANEELKKNLAPATYLVNNFKQEDITKTLLHCQENFSELNWNLHTVKKQIIHVTKKK